MKKEATTVQKAVIAVFVGFILLSIPTFTLKDAEKPMLSSHYGKSCYKYGSATVTASGVGDPGPFQGNPSEGKNELCERHCKGSAGSEARSDCETQTSAILDMINPNCQSPCGWWQSQTGCESDTGGVTGYFVSWVTVPGGAQGYLCGCSGTATATNFIEWGCGQYTYRGVFSEKTASPGDPSGS